MQKRAVLLLFAILLAGCGEKKSDPANEDDEYDPFSDYGLDTQEGLGVIRGVVVDQDVATIAGATVTLQLDGRQVKTNSEGLFGFGNVTAGGEFIEITKAGYFSKTVEVLVVADEPTPDITKVELLVDPSAPYVEPFVWEGYIQCSMGSIPTCRALSRAGTEEETFTVHEVAAAPQWVQSEMTWSPGQVLSDELWLWHTYGDASADGFQFFQQSFGDVQGESNLILATSPESAAAAGKGDEFAKLGVDHDFIPMVFGGAIEESRALCGVAPRCFGVGFTLEQYFTVYTHAFQGFQPPDGWEFARDGVPEPQ